MEDTKYISDEAVIRALKPLLKDKHISIVWGTWCGDSRLHVPNFYQILADAGFAEKDVTLIEVDRDKQAENVSIEHLNIERVPTFIIFAAAQEVGRIVEHPAKTLEKDLLDLLTGDRW